MGYIIEDLGINSDCCHMQQLLLLLIDGCHLQCYAMLHIDIPASSLFIIIRRAVMVSSTVSGAHNGNDNEY